MHESVLVYRSFLYLKWAAAVVLAAIILYAWHDAVPRPNGGTWLGYGLGTLGALLIVWLMWFGVRKRRYGKGRLLLEDWLSAHVYLGLALIVVATLHTGFQFGWNVHTLAYALMMIVIASGVFGLVAYVRLPDVMTENRRGLTLDQLMLEIAELDQEIRQTALPLGDEINQAVLDAASKTQIGGSLRKQLSGKDKNCPTRAALEKVQSMAGSIGLEHSDTLRKLLPLLSRKNELVEQARRDVRYKALMDVWLYFHVPLSFALLAALATHIIVVFFYW